MTRERERTNGEDGRTARSGTEPMPPAPERHPAAVPGDRSVGASRGESRPMPPADYERRDGDDRRVVAERVDEERRREERREADRAARERRGHIAARVTQAVDYVFYLLYGLLAIRFVLALLGASETAGFVRFIGGLTEPFYAPFSGIVARPSVNGGFLDFPLLIAVLAYALLHLAIRGLIRLVAGATRGPA